MSKKNLLNIDTKTDFENFSLNEKKNGGAKKKVSKKVSKKISKKSSMMKGGAVAKKKVSKKVSKKSYKKS